MFFGFEKIVLKIQLTRHSLNQYLVSPQSSESWTHDKLPENYNEGVYGSDCSLFLSLFDDLWYIMCTIFSNEQSFGLFFVRKCLLLTVIILMQEWMCGIVNF